MMRQSSGMCQRTVSWNHHRGLDEGMGPHMQTLRNPLRHRVDARKEGRAGEKPCSSATQEMRA
jgi:hypothetical protein